MIKNIILDFMNDKQYVAQDAKELAQDIVAKYPELSLNEVSKTIIELEKSYLIFSGKRNRLRTREALNLYEGTLDIKRKGFGFVRCDNFDVYVAKDDLNNAINRDRVLVRVNKPDELGQRDGVIYQILHHGYEYIVGTVEIGRQILVIPDDDKLDFKIAIKPKDSQNVVNGSKVLCEMKDVDERTGLIYGVIKKIIGHVNDVGMDILSIVYQHGFKPDFSEEAMQQASSFDYADIVVGGRKDLRDKEFITIDGADAKDLDDAIYLEINEANNRVLYVSIADVSYYVSENSPLDQEAYARGTSVYLVDRVVPMIPHQLSNGICSLLPDVDRLTQTAQMEFDEEGKLVSYDIYESIINSKKRFTYDEVNQIIADDKEVIDENAKFIDMLSEMQELALKLRRIKYQRGALNFEIPEPKIIVDKNSDVVDIKIRQRGEAEKLIEDFMIVANETVAQHIYWQELPFIYRTHDKPDAVKIKDFLTFVQPYNIKMKGSVDNLSPKDIQKLLEEINDKEGLEYLDTLLLRSMAKAVYQRVNVGHFGLASTCYTHFTSPIRRYPDLIVHRFLREYVYHKMIPSAKKILTLDDKFDRIGEQASKKERDAIEAERDVNDLKMAEYMAEHIGEKFTGRITSVLNFGFFVELDNTIEGLVHASNLDDDYYVYVDKRHILVGQRTSRIFSLGQKVEVVVDAVNVKARAIDFKLVSKNKKRRINKNRNKSTNRNKSNNKTRR